jgi:hypothetical protein
MTDLGLHWMAAKPTIQIRQYANDLENGKIQESWHVVWWEAKKKRKAVTH